MRILLTWDSKAEAAVTKHLQSEDPSIAVNPLRFPGGIMNIGVDSGEEDEFLNVLRVEGVKEAKARESFYSSPPVQVYRLTPPSRFVVPKSSLFPSFDGHMRKRWTGIKEHAYGVTNQALKGALARLEQAVISKHRQSPHDVGYTVVPFTSFVNDSGYECLKDGSRCQGDCRDTIYARATLLPQELLCNKTGLGSLCKPSRRSELSSDSNDRLFAVGVNHRLTNQSLYGSLTAYNYPKLASGSLRDLSGKYSYTVMEDESLNISAAPYLSDVPEHREAIPYLYVIEFARNCTGATSFCYEIASEETPPTAASAILPIALDSPVILMERMYIHPGTKSGPAVAETILPKMIHFRPRKW